jgi:hypothetical protein
MSQQIHNSSQSQKHKKEAKAALAFKNLARQYFDLQRLRQQVRVAECGKTAGDDWLPDSHKATDRSMPCRRRSGYSNLYH